MSADAASLPCPICSHTGVFDSVQSLRDRLICVSTNKILCPVCQEEVTGLDKLTIHLFSHVKLLNTKRYILENNKNADTNCESKPDNQNMISSQQKKLKGSVSKNKSTSSTTTAPVKYVKIYPKLPVVSVNTVSVVSQRSSYECTQKNTPVNTPVVKTEPSLIQTNTTCNVCGLQFVDANILKMHKCLIHNIDDNSNQNFTRYQCHLCPKNFKMRGSLMVHLRVAHFGFSSPISKTDDDGVKTEDKNTEGLLDNKSVRFERNDNKQWQCDVCQKCFTTKYFLKKHKRLHTGETPYACTQCNKTFTFQQSYHKHLLYHNDEKPHTCSYCGRAFKELSTLHNHQRIHTGEKPFSCESCGKCFRQRVSYLVHRRIHTGVMPYKCTACNKSFRYKVSQRTHKCQAQPPGTVVRQTGDLVEKLIKKHANSIQTIINEVQLDENVMYPEISEANAELVRSGAKLSLEDTETENFTLIEEAFNNKEQSSTNNINEADLATVGSTIHIFNPNIDELIESIPIVDKNLPSPSEILRNLSLSKEDDYIFIRQDKEELSNYDMYKDLFL